MRKQPFAQLRGDMKANGLENPDIAKIMEKSDVHVSRCLNCKAQFTLSDQYAIMKAIRRPSADLHVIFPEGGAV